LYLFDNKHTVEHKANVIGFDKQILEMILETWMMDMKKEIKEGIREVITDNRRRNSHGSNFTVGESYVPPRDDDAK